MRETAERKREIVTLDMMGMGFLSRMRKIEHEQRG